MLVTMTWVKTSFRYYLNRVELFPTRRWMPNWKANCNTTPGASFY